MRSLLLAVLAVTSTACSSSLEVTRSFTPTEAVAQQEGRLRVVSVARGQETLRVSPNARIESDRIYWPNEPGEHRVPLLRGDVIQKDDQGRIVAIRSARPDGGTTRFVPGTATSPVGLTNPPAEPGGFESEPLKAAWVGSRSRAALGAT